VTEFRAPTDEQIKEAIRRIPTPQLRRAFFEGLKNPLWVGPLAREGAFSNPPEPEKTDDGLIRDIYWPEIDYLTRAAPDSPEAVVDVLLKLAKSNNAWVRRGVFEIGATVPADQAARLQPLVKSWLSSGFGWRTDPKGLISYAVNMLQGGEHEVGRWFANLIFKPSKVENHRKPNLALEDYWYEQGLPKVAAALGPDGLELVLSWLVAFERHNGHLTKKSDITYFSRDSIRQADDSLYVVEQALIDAVRDLAYEAMLADPAVAKDVLLNSNMLLARKIALFSLGQALERVDRGDERLNQLLVVANDLLSDEASSSDSCRIDYAELARAVARTTGEPLAVLTRVIETGPRVDGDRLRDWVRGDTSDEAEVDDRVRDYIHRWRHRWLSALGTEALPAPLQTKLAKLDAQYGVIEGPLVSTRHIEGWTGPNSPLSQDEMAAMTPAELGAHLESWHDTGNRWGPEPSHEGQGRELQALLTTNPKALAGVEDLIGRLRPTYLRAMFQGWEAALKADLELDWTQVTNLIGGVLAHGDESDFPAEGGEWDDDADFRSAKQAAVGLLEELGQKRASPVIPDDVMSQFAEMLVTLAADETAWNEYIGYDGGSGMDPLTTSLNWQWPIRLRGLIHLMSRGKDTAWYEAARSALETELAREDTRGASRAVLGEGLGRLVDVDHEWLTPKIPELFGSEAGLTVAQQIALTTAMAVHRYHPKLDDLLTAPMIAAIDPGEPIVSGWDTHTDPLQRIGEWVIDAIIRGHKSIDDPVAHTFFSAAPAKVRGEAIGHIAWAFMHAEVVDDEIRDRFAVLWDQRMAHVRDHPEDKEELNGFYWFVKSTKFAVEWWLPRLKEAAELDPDLSTERYMIGKEVASSADVDPRGAFDVLTVLLEGRDEAGMASYDLTRNAVPMVIARAIDSGDEVLKQDAVAFMNMLGEKGNLSLEAEVNRVREGTITQSDVDG
jgi:hypothetical protein